VDLDTGRTIAKRVEIADSFFRRFRGLMLRRSLEVDKALLFKFKNLGRHSVHMFFMRFPIDLVYLDSSSRVVEIKKSLKPWRVHVSKVDSKFLLELPGGAVDRSKIDLGHKISASAP
jgi:uncharacterized membrane protein (UPF0127 family)